jgi:hypothetical protein
LSVLIGVHMTESSTKKSDESYIVLVEQTPDLVLIIGRNHHTHIVFVHMLYGVGGICYKGSADFRPHATDIVILHIN